VFSDSLEHAGTTGFSHAGMTGFSYAGTTGFSHAGMTKWVGFGTAYEGGLKSQHTP